MKQPKTVREIHEELLDILVGDGGVDDFRDAKRIIREAIKKNKLSLRRRGELKRFLEGTMFDPKILDNYSEKKYTNIFK